LNVGRSRLSDRWGAGLSALGVLLIASTAAGQASATEQRLTGEHGLWVSHEDDRVTVRWVTRHEMPGLLEALNDGRPIARVTTEAGFAHRAEFKTDRATDVLLRYGAAEDPDDRHETVVSLRTPRRPPVAVSGVDSLYVLGDTHGEYDALLQGLASAGLIDGDLGWTGGRSHVAFAGDLTGRGPDVLGLLWLVYRLEREAAAAGGAIHVLLGNHEVMVLLGDLRYVHPKEMRVARLHQAAYDHMFNARTSILGRWLASKPALIRVDRALIAHGGLGNRYADYDLVEFDDTLRTYVGEKLFERWADTTRFRAMDSATFQRRDDFFWHPESVFWHRAFVQSDTASALLVKVLDRMDSDLLVVGHTRVARVQARYDGRLIAAHTPQDGAELLLLVRRRDGYDRVRVTATGNEPLRP
jgi:hypothetical protein